MLPACRRASGAAGRRGAGTEQGSGFQESRGLDSSLCVGGPVERLLQRMTFLLLVAIPLLGAPVATEASGVGPIRFDGISLAEGLSQSTVLCIFQYSRGFIWIGTEDGLNRYDGYRFELFEHDPLDPDSLGTNDVSKMVVDGDGTLWLGMWGPVSSISIPRLESRFTTRKSPARWTRSTTTASRH